MVCCNFLSNFCSFPSDFLRTKQRGKDGTTEFVFFSVMENGGILTFELGIDDEPGKSSAFPFGMAIFIQAKTESTSAYKKIYLVLYIGKRNCLNVFHFWRLFSLLDLIRVHLWDHVSKKLFSKSGYKDSCNHNHVWVF